MAPATACVGCDWSRPHRLQAQAGSSPYTCSHRCLRGVVSTAAATESDGPRPQPRPAQGPVPRGAGSVWHHPSPAAGPSQLRQHPWLRVSGPHRHAPAPVCRGGSGEQVSCCCVGPCPLAHHRQRLLHGMNRNWCQLRTSCNMSTVPVTKQTATICKACLQDGKGRACSAVVTEIRLVS